MKRSFFLIFFLLPLYFFACSKGENNGKNNELEYNIYWLENSRGIKIKVTDFGARVMEIWVPDKNGQSTDIVLGYETVEEYEGSSEVYFGASIGRYGNRIANGVFELEGETFRLAQNNGQNSLHGGPKGFHNVRWIVEEASPSRIVFTYLSEDGEEGFPGNLSVKMIYSLNEEGEFTISYEAETDRLTVVNLTHHSFFNLNGAGSRDILDHQLMIVADGFIAVDQDLIPLGGISEVEGTAFDFRDSKAIGATIELEEIQLKYGGGYDHNWVLSKNTPEALELAAIVFSENSGIKMEVYTTAPGLQFYSGNFLNGSEKGKQGKVYDYRGAFCLETQHFPDSPNQPDFPSVSLKPGETYTHQCIYKFKTKEE
jgi:aldose 1-epimerase